MSVAYRQSASRFYRGSLENICYDLTYVRSSYPRRSHNNGNNHHHHSYSHNHTATESSNAVVLRRMDLTAPFRPGPPLHAATGDRETAIYLHVQYLPSQSTCYTDQGRQHHHHQQEVSLDDVQLEKATRISARHLQEVSLTRKYTATREKRLGPGKRKKSRNRRSKGKQRKTIETEDTTMDEIDNASEGPKAAREHLNIISKPENSPKAAQRVEDVARIASLRREASGPVRAIQSTPSLVRLHHTQELWSFSSKTQEDY